MREVADERRTERRFDKDYFANLRSNYLRPWACCLHAEHLTQRHLALLTVDPALPRCLRGVEALMTHVRELPRYQLDIQVHPAILGGIRRIVAAHLRLWCLDDLETDVCMAATELLGNVYKHADKPKPLAVLQLEVIPEHLRLTVSDRSSTAPVVREPDWCAESGRGMFLVKEASVGWGVTFTAEGKDVWALFPRTAKELSHNSVRCALPAAG